MTPSPAITAAIEAAAKALHKHHHGDNSHWESAKAVYIDRATVAFTAFDHHLSGALTRAVDGGWRDIESAPKDGTHVLVMFADQNSPATVAHWFGPPDLPGLRSGGWYLSVQQMEGPRIHPTHWQPVPSESRS